MRSWASREGRDGQGLSNHGERVQRVGHRPGMRGLQFRSLEGLGASLGSGMGITVVKSCQGSLAIIGSYWEQGLGGHRVQELRSQWGDTVVRD